MVKMDAVKELADAGGPLGGITEMEPTDSPRDRGAWGEKPSKALRNALKERDEAEGLRVDPTTPKRRRRR